MLAPVDISNAHNLPAAAPADATGRYGIRVTLPATDPFARLVDEGWSATHWYESRHERDAALADMARQHEYSRDGDRPTLIFTAIERDADS